MAGKLHDLRVKIREGCRGGSEQFSWSSIKDQDFKDREEYLGGTMKVGLQAKFGRYYLHDWYAKKRETTESIDSELATVKAYEEELMQEALGLKPKKLLLQKKQLSEEEIKKFLRPDAEKKPDQESGFQTMGPQKKVVANEFGEQVATSNEDYIADGGRDSIKGIGFAMHRTAKLEEIKAATLGTTAQLLGSKDMPIKIEDFVKTEIKQEIGDHFTLGMSSSSSSGFRVKKEEDAVKEEPVKQETKKEEGVVKDEDIGAEKAAWLQEASKRTRDEGEIDGQGDHKKAKKSKEEKKEKKKQKKAKKKLKKAEKKMKKQEKREEKARAAKRLGKQDARSSSSSSSSS